jgi:glycosyltransferase involved in cell wall biosynthesis
VTWRSLQLSDRAASATVLLVPSVSVPSGVVTYVLGIAKVLEAFSLGVVAEPNSPLAMTLPANCELIPTSPSRVGMTLSVARHQRRFAFIQAHGPRALLAARLAGVPGRRLGYVFHEINGPHARYELLIARGASLAANGRAAAEWVTNRAGVPVPSLPPVVQMVGALPRSEARHRLGLPAEGLVIGVVGRLSSVKLPTLAVESVAQTGLDAALVFVGEGPERANILAAADRHGVRVYLPGSLENASRVASAFDVVLSCSPRETFGLAVAEAIVSGIPVVGVDSPGLRELSDDGQWLHLVPPTARAIADAIKVTIGSGGPPTELREHVLRVFGAEAAAAIYQPYYASELMRAN